jgi:plastocyanin
MVVGTLIAFALSRSDRGVFGFTERGFQPAPQAGLTVTVELVALVALLATFVPRVGAGSSIPLRLAAPLAASVLLSTVVMSVLWNREPAQIATRAPAVAPAGVPVSEGAAQPAGATAAAVAIADFAFGPPEITVAVGATVTWTNQDSVSHTVDANDNSFVSESLGQGATFSHTFDVAGTFAYICGIHPSMAGTVVVTG